MMDVGLLTKATNPFAIMEAMEQFMEYFRISAKMGTGLVKSQVPIFRMQANAMKFLPESLEGIIIDQAINNIEANANYVRETFRKSVRPEFPIPYETIGENDLKKIHLVKNDYKGDRVFMLDLPLMRGIFLAGYREPGNDDIKCYIDALEACNAGHIVFVENKQPDNRTKNANEYDHLKADHMAKELVAERLGKPNSISLCQPGPFANLNLAKNPDDVITNTLVASPYSYIDSDSILYDVIMKITESNVESYLGLRDGVANGGDIARFWGGATYELMLNSMITAPSNEYIQHMTNLYNVYRSRTFKDWMEKDVVDIPGPTYKFIVNELTKKSLMLQDAPLGYSQKNYKNPTIVVTGTKDDIVTEFMALCVFDFIGSYIKEHYVVPGGHAAVFNGTKAMKETMKTIIPRIMELDKQMKGIELYSH